MPRILSRVPDISWAGTGKGGNYKFGLGQVFKAWMSAGPPSGGESAIGQRSLEFRGETQTAERHLATSLFQEHVKPRDWVRPPGERHRQVRDEVILTMMKLRHRRLNDLPKDTLTVSGRASGTVSI